LDFADSAKFPFLFALIAESSKGNKIKLVAVVSFSFLFFFFSLSVFSLSCYKIKLYIRGQFGFGKDFEGILCNFSGFLNFSDDDFIGAGLSGMG